MRTRTWLIVALLAGCGGGSSGTTGGAPGADAGGPGADAGASAGADAGPQSDQEWCQQACTKLIGCGVAYDATCASNCLMAPVFLGCVKQAPQDCNSLALCAFQQASAVVCGGANAAVPAGAGTCAAAAMCEGECTATNQPPSCSCGCWQALASGKALSLLVNNECSNARCKVECNTPGAGAACLACFSQKCAAENGQCTAN